MSNQISNLDSDIRIVFKLQYAAKMQLLGHKLLSTMPNPNDHLLICWIFQLDQTFDSDLQKLIKEGKDKKNNHV